MVGEDDAPREGDFKTLSVAKSGGEDAGGGEPKLRDFDEATARDGVVRDGVLRKSRLQDVASGAAPVVGGGSWA